MTESGKESVAGCLVLLSLPVYCSDTVREWVFVDAGPVLAGLIGVVAMIVILRDHGIALRETIRQTKRVPEGSEPAIRQYFFSAAWKELAGSTQSAFLTVKDRYRDGFGVVGHLGEAGCLAIPVALVYIAALSAAAFVAAVTFAAGVALHCVIVVIGAAVSVAVVATLLAAELLSMAVRRIYLVCPNRDCHRRISLPAYSCPSCAAVHHALLPGSYGAFRRRCRCGAWLPTLFLLGRSRIPAYCPHASCGRPLSDAIGSAREWLLQSGERNLVQSIEHDFKTVRFFTCSSLGRTPSARADAFVPWGVVQPFEWLAEASGVSLR